VVERHRALKVLLAFVHFEAPRRFLPHLGEYAVEIVRQGGEIGAADVVEDDAQIHLEVLRPCRRRGRRRRRGHHRKRNDRPGDGHRLAHRGRSHGRGDDLGMLRELCLDIQIRRVESGRFPQRVKRLGRATGLDEFPRHRLQIGNGRRAIAQRLARAPSAGHDQPGRAPRA
jgi:hypothetical protein